MSYEQLEFASSFASEQCPEGACRVPNNCVFFFLGGRSKIPEVGAQLGREKAPK